MPSEGTCTGNTATCGRVVNDGGNVIGLWTTSLISARISATYSCTSCGTGPDEHRSEIMRSSSTRAYGGALVIPSLVKKKLLRYGYERQMTALDLMDGGPCQ